MLHKSNTLKHVLILPVLVVFLTSYGKEIPVNLFSDEANALFGLNTKLDFDVLEKKKHTQLIITKNSDKDDLNKIKDQLKKEGITIKFNGIKRNKKDEITAIKIEVKAKQSNANYSVSSDEAINPIEISFDDEGNNISIGNSNALHHAKGYSFISKDGKHKFHNSSGNSAEVYFFSDDEDNQGHKNKFIVKRRGKKGKHKVMKLHKSTKIISGDNDDVIEIIIENDNDDSNIFIYKNKGDNNQSLWTNNEEHTIKIGKGSSIFISDNDGKNPLFIVDGKQISNKKLNDFDADSIEKIEVLKGDSAIEKYGEKGKDGVVIITTKKN